MANKITSTAPGERAVKVNGEYAGLIVREKDGWRWMGNPKTFRTFTEAAQNVGERYLRRKEAERVKAEVKPGDAVTLREKATGYETWHRVQSVSAIPAVGTWTLLVGGLNVPYRSADYEFVRVETGTGW